MAHPKTNLTNLFDLEMNSPYFRTIFKSSEQNVKFSSSKLLSDKIIPVEETRETVSVELREAISDTNIAILGAKVFRNHCVVTYKNRFIADRIGTLLTAKGYTTVYSDINREPNKLTISW